MAGEGAPGGPTGAQLAEVPAVAGQGVPRAGGADAGGLGAPTRAPGGRAPRGRTPAWRCSGAPAAPLQLHACVPGEGANPGPGPVPWSKVPGSWGARINYQPKTVRDKGGGGSVWGWGCGGGAGGSAGADLFSANIPLPPRHSSPSENCSLQTGTGCSDPDPGPGLGWELRGSVAHSQQLPRSRDPIGWRRCNLGPQALAPGPGHVAT